LTENAGILMQSSEWTHSRRKKDSNVASKVDYLRMAVNKGSTAMLASYFRDNMH
jgi:hypothetical protein